MFDPILKAIGWLLALFYAVIPDVLGIPKQDYALGVAIILLTFTIMLLLYPLTAKQARSMIAMQMHQPEIKRIQAKFKNDRQKMNEEVMKYYQEHKINPLAGCLPLVIQLPIFFALFRVLRSPYKYVPVDSKLYAAFCTPKGHSDPVSVKLCSGDYAPYKNVLPIHQKFLGVDLSVTAPNQITTVATIVAFSFVALSVLSGFMQSRQASRRTPQTNKQMATIMKVLPVAFGLFSLQFPAGLVLYFCVSNFWRLGQQEVIFRRYGTASNPTHRAAVKPAKTSVVDVESRERSEIDGDDYGVPDDPLELEAGPTTPAEGSGAEGSGAKGPGAKSAGAAELAGTKGAGKPAAKAPAKSGAKAPAKSGAGNGAKPVAPPPKSGGGLRSIFQLPPPPGEVPKAAPAKPAASKSSSAAKKPTNTTSSTTARPGTTGRRTSKKKRKR
jgi:YidC/Oxa1 family membrane protein insertase